MANIGTEQREITVEPLELPEPLREIEPEPDPDIQIPYLPEEEPVEVPA